MKYARRTDFNQQMIVAALRKMGCEVFVTSGIGSGMTDLIVGLNGRVWLVELKDGNKTASRRKLTPLEASFAVRWAHSYIVLKSVNEAIEFVNRVKLGQAGVHFDKAQLERVEK